LRAARDLRQRQRLAGFQDAGQVGHGRPWAWCAMSVCAREIAPCPNGKGVR
jgi:hypothetical protein